MEIKVVFTNKNGFITDFGKPLVLTATERSKNTQLCEVPRYGVWMAERGKSQVVFTTNDIDEARAKLSGTVEEFCHCPSPKPFFNGGICGTCKLRTIPVVQKPVPGGRMISMPWHLEMDGNELDCSLYIGCVGEYCEMAGDRKNPCHASAPGMLLGTSDGHDPKFCVIHYFQANGAGTDYKLIVDPPEKVEGMTADERLRFRELRTKFANAALELLEAWRDGGEFTEEYPFPQSFDEVVSGILAWDKAI